MLGGTTEQADELFQPIDKIIKSMRAGVDSYCRFFDNEIDDELAKVINDGLGSYMTKDYRLFVQGGLANTYKPLAQQKTKALTSRYDQLLKDPKNVNRTKESLKVQAAKDVDDFIKYKGLENPSSQRLVQKEQGEIIKSKLTQQEREGLKIDTTALLPRRLKEYQRITNL